MYSPCLKLLLHPSSSVPPSTHQSPASYLSPASCVNVNFTPLMFKMSITVRSLVTLSLPALLSPWTIPQSLSDSTPESLGRNDFRLVSHPVWQHKHTSFLLLADGELYAGTSADFMGRDFAIFRTLGKHHPIRTEQHDSRWLNGESEKENDCSTLRKNLGLF